MTLLFIPDPIAVKAERRNLNLKRRLEDIYQDNCDKAGRELTPEENTKMILQKLKIAMPTKFLRNTKKKEK